MCSLTCCAHGRLHNWTSSGNNQRRLVSGFSKPTGICSSTHSLMTEIVNCAMALPCSTALCSLGDNPGRPHRSTSDLRALGMPLPPRPRRARDHDEQSVPSQTPHTFLARRAAMSTACNWASQRSNPSLMSSPRLVSPAVPTAAQRPASPPTSSRKNWVPSGGEHPSEPQDHLPTEAAPTCGCVWAVRADGPLTWPAGPSGGCWCQL